MFLHGDGIAANQAKAIGFYRTACDAGNPTGCLGVAEVYDRGEGVPSEPGRSVELWEWGCDTGSGVACNNLAVAYAKGRGLPPDPSKAYGFYRKACERQNADGCKNAERAYDAGTGLPPDDARKRADQVSTNRKMERAHPGQVWWLDTMRRQGPPDCPHGVAFDLVQKLPEPHAYEGIIAGGVGGPDVHIIIRTKQHEFTQPGRKSICLRPEETWTTVTTRTGFTEARMVFEEAL
jgi:hypothetical protein